jgi:exopolysaccharide biosynthesis polyprenyl glycosylphosphotransferase
MTSHAAVLDLVDERTAEILDLRRRSGIMRRGWLVRRMLLVADLVGLTLAFLLSELLFLHHGGGDRVALAGELLVFGLSLPVWVVTAKIYGLYDRDEDRADHSTADDMVGVFHLVTVGTWLLLIGSYVTHLAHPQLPKLVTFWTLAVAGLPLSRFAARSICRRHISYLQNTAIVGAGDIGQLLARKLLNHPEYGLNLVGFFDSRPKERRPELEGLTILGGIDEVPAVVKLLDVERVLVAFSDDQPNELIPLLRELNELDVQVDIVPRFFDVLSTSVDLHSVEGIPLIGVRPPRLSRSSALIKRVVDVVGAAAGLLLLAPLFAAVAVAVKLDTPGPVFFRQVRMGCGERTFRIWKFRTMHAGADERKHEVAHLNKHLAPGGDARMFKIPNDPRITRVGRFLRRTSLDEIPQLLNVVTGEMSIVGPRPLILDEDQFVSDWRRRRLDLKPGVTGLWQVLGRDDIPFDEMVRLDYLYVTNWSLLNDLKLILRTFPVLARAAEG